MKKIPTAAEYLKTNANDISYEGKQLFAADVTPEMLITFAKLHVQAALKAAAKKLKTCTNPESDAFLKSFISKEQILSAYSLENIK